MTLRLDRPLDPDADIVIGDPEGRARLVWFVDFADPDTRRIRDVLLRAATKFDPGHAALAIRFLPGRGDGIGSDVAARAAWAAWRQGRYREMHRALFAARPPYSEDSVTRIAAELGLDAGRFAADLRSEAAQRKLTEDRASFRGAERAVSPLLFVDGRIYDDAWDESALIEAIERPLGVRLRLASEDFFQWAASAGLVLVLASAVALLVANLGLAAIYEWLRSVPIGIVLGESQLVLPLATWVNDGLMSVFFLVVGVEIKRELIDGELSHPGRAVLPILAAIGGMAVPAAIYAALTWGEPVSRGWGIPMATDIAFTLGVMALLGDRVPMALKVFVSALAIVDDLGAILVVALFYSHGIDTWAAVGACGLFVAMMAMNRARIYARAPYLLLGLCLWVLIHDSGVHPTLAGVLTAAAIPSRRSASVEGVAAQTAALFAEELEAERPAAAEITLARLRRAIERLREPGQHVRGALENWVNFAILPLFAFFNTGIVVAQGAAHPPTPEMLGVFLGLVLGKPLGIVGTIALAIRFRWGRMSAEIGRLQILGTGVLAGIGFTMSIFISQETFGEPGLTGVKLAVLAASLVSACLGAALLAAAGRRPAPRGRG